MANLGKTTKQEQMNIDIALMIQDNEIKELVEEQVYKIINGNVSIHQFSKLKDAIQSSNNEKFDIALVRLGRESDADSIQQMRSRFPDIQFIVMTSAKRVGEKSLSNALQAKDLGCEVIVKPDPSSSEALEESLRKAIDYCRKHLLPLEEITYTADCKNLIWDHAYGSAHLRDRELLRNIGDSVNVDHVKSLSVKSRREKISTSNATLIDIIFNEGSKDCKAIVSKVFPVSGGGLGGALETSIYETCRENSPSPYMIESFGYIKNKSHIGTLLREIKGPSLDYHFLRIFPKIRGYRRKIKVERGEKDKPDKNLIDEWKKREKEYTAVKNKIISDSLKAVADINARWTLLRQKIINKAIEICGTKDVHKVLYKEMEESNKNRINRYMKFIALHLVKSSPEGWELDLSKAINSFEFTGNDKAKKVGDTFHRLMADKKRNVLSHGDLRTHHLSIHIGGIKTIDLCRARFSRIGVDALELLTDHFLDLEHKEIKAYYQYYLVNFGRKYLKLSHDLARNKDRNTFIRTYLKDPNASQVSSIEDFKQSAVAEEFENLSFILPIIRLRKMGPLAEYIIKNNHSHPRRHPIKEAWIDIPESFYNSPEWKDLHVPTIKEELKKPEKIEPSHVWGKNYYDDDYIQDYHINRLQEWANEGNGTLKGSAAQLKRLLVSRKFKITDEHGITRNYELKLLERKVALIDNS